MVLYTQFNIKTYKNIMAQVF